MHEPSDFLQAHATEVNEFLQLLHGQLDHATPEAGDKGGLRMPYGADNVLAARWVAPHPVLPDELQGLSPHIAGEPVDIHARYRYGHSSALINLWLNSLPDADTHSSFSFNLSVSPRTGDVLVTPLNLAGSDKNGRTETSEDLAKPVFNVVFAENSTYLSAATALTIGDRYRLGIMSQTDYGAEQYTFERGEKVVLAPRRFGRGAMQFEVGVNVTDRTHPGGKASKTIVSATTDFTPQDYDPTAPYAGRLTRQLHIVRQIDGSITNIDRLSNIQLYSHPSVAFVNGKPTIIPTTGDTDDYEVPEQLATKIYPDSIPTLQDLEYFTKLVTLPIKNEDTWL